VRLAEHDEMVERFATDRSDEPLNVAVLPRRAWCGGVISDPHCTDAAGVRRTEYAVAVANQVMRRFVPEKRVSYLTANATTAPPLVPSNGHSGPGDPVGKA
jgi:hypothetical protein